MSTVQVHEYVPHTIIKPGRVLSGSYGTTSWNGLESVLADLLDHFHVGRSCALEFGCEHGYSLVALSAFFGRVIGVDPFGQRTATEPVEPMVNRCRRNVFPYDNIHLHINSWQDFIRLFDTDADHRHAFPLGYDLVHVDGEHGYYDTFGSGDWACEHAPVVLFHDTLSFPDTVMPACRDLAAKHGRTLYNYTGHVHGLGILVDKEHQP